MALLALDAGGVTLLPRPRLTFRTGALPASADAAAAPSPRLRNHLFRHVADLIAIGAEWLPS